MLNDIKVGRRLEVTRTLGADLGVGEGSLGVVDGDGLVSLGEKSDLALLLEPVEGGDHMESAQCARGAHNGEGGRAPHDEPGFRPKSQSVPTRMDVREGSSDSPGNSTIDRRSNRQDSVVLEDDGLLVLERDGDGSRLLLLDDDATKVAEQCDVVVEGARVLRRDGEGLAERRVGLAVDRVRVADSLHVGTGLVDSRVDLMDKLAS